ncbi:MAG: phage virion morphogenesis protein [Mesorhizobium sp.]
MEIGVSIVIDASSIDGALAALAPILEFESSEMMSAIGQLGEHQTRRRIESEKTSPDGAAWPPNLKGTSILAATGTNLFDSIAQTSTAEQAEWGASWEFAHIHQEGAIITPKNARYLAVPAAAFGAVDGVRYLKSVTIPARPFVGISDANAQEIIDLVTDHFGLAQ